MRKTILFGMIFLLSVSFASAALSDDLIIYYKMDDGSVWTDEQGTIDATVSGVSDTASGKIGNGASFDSVNDYANITAIYFSNETSFSIQQWVKYSSQSAENEYLFGPNAIYAPRCYTGDGGNNQKIYCQMGASVGNLISVGYSSTSVGDNNWHQIVYVWNSSDSNFKVYIDNSAEILSGSGSVDDVNSTTQFAWGYGWGVDYYGGTMDEIGIWHKALTPEDINDLYNNGNGLAYENFSAAEPPTITQNTYNVTSSEGDGLVWRTDTSIAVNTTDPTSTVKFDISETGNCSIGLNDWNYTHMIANGSIDCGMTSTKITCTLPTTQALSEGNQNIYSSCISNDGIESVNSTSGPLSITLLEASTTETLARSRIETAINNVLTSPTIYTDEQIYLRQLDGTQQLGTFDKVAVSGSQRWAINYVTGNETYTNMGNLTPVFYVFETTNITMNQLQSDVEAFLNSTKS